MSSIYFGGGTPSLLSAGQIAGILTTVRTAFAVAGEAEITIEANPGTVDRAYLSALRAMGINRLSLGVQSLDDHELALLGRIHTATGAREAVRLARDAGFDNINLDLIYGLPGQTLSAWRNTLRRAIEMGPEHLSLYALTLEEDTPMWRTVREQQLPAVDPDRSADQYQAAEDMLAEQGYRHYEISNWARPGRECRHNLGYWLCRPYLGVGVAAHSFLDGRRLANTGSLDAYLAAYSGGHEPALEMDEHIGPDLEIAERIILGLRLCEGISLEDMPGIDFGQRYRRQIAEMEGAGLLEYGDGRIRLTRRGRLLSNEVFWRFLPEPAGAH